MTPAEREAKGKTKNRKSKKVKTMKRMYDRCDTFTVGIEIAWNRKAYDARWIALRLGFRMLGVEW